MLVTWRRVVKRVSPIIGIFFHCLSALELKAYIEVGISQFLNLFVCLQRYVQKCNLCYSGKFFGHSSGISLFTIDLRRTCHIVNGFGVMILTTTA